MPTVWPSDLWRKSEDDLLSGQLKPLTDRLESSFRQYQQAATAPEPTPEPAPQPFRLPSPSDIFGGVQEAASSAVETVRSVLPSPSSIFGEPEQPTSQTPINGANVSPGPALPRTSRVGVPSAMPTAARMLPSTGEQIGDITVTNGADEDDEQYIRAAAIKRGIDPQKAVDVANTEGGANRAGRARPNMQGAPAYSHFQLYIGGPGNPGMGDEALASGIDPRDPNQWREAIDFALDRALERGWQPFQGAAAAGIGDWEGIRGNARPAVPVSTADQPEGQTWAAGGLTPNQIDAATAEGLDYETALAVCGPAAAIAFARKTGRNPTMQEALGLAREVGWTVEQGMAGPASQQRLLDRLGVASRMVDGTPDWGSVAADVQRGNPVILSTPGHYFVAERYNPEDGTFDLGQSATVLKASGGRRWFRPEEIASLGMGEPRASLFMDSPQSPSPSVVAGRTPPNAGPGSASPPAVAGAPSPLDAARAGPQAQQPMMQRTSLHPSDQPPTTGGTQADTTGTPPPPGAAFPLDPRPDPIYDREGIDRTNDDLTPIPGAPGGPWENPGGPWPQLEVPPGTMLRGPLSQQPADMPLDGGASPPAPPARDDWRTEQPVPPSVEIVGATTGPVETPEGYTRVEAPSQTVQVEPQPAPPAVAAEPEVQQQGMGSGLLPVFDEVTQQVVGYVRRAATAASNVLNYGRPEDAPQPVQAFPGEPDYRPSETYFQAADRRTQERAGQSFVERAQESLGQIGSAVQSFVSPTDEQRAERQRAYDQMRVEAQDALGPVVEPVEQTVTGAATAVEQAIGAPEGSFRQAAEDASAFFPGVAAVRVAPALAATAEQVAAASKRGASHGARLNAPLSPRQSAVPRAVRAATKLTDDRAATRWAEDMLTDAAGQPRLAENDVARPSTQSRVNAGAVGDERITSELEPAVMSAARSGLQDELPQYLDDMHARDVLDDVYHKAREASLADGATEIAADQAGIRAVRRAQGRGPDNTYEAIDARIRAQEERLAASGQWDALQESAEAIWEHNRQTMRRLRDAGRISQDDLEAWEAAYPHAVPTRQVSRLDPNGADSGALLDPPTLQGERLNPVVASRNLTLAGEREVQRNQVFTSFARLFDEAVDAGGILPGPDGVRRLWDGDKDVIGYVDGVRTVFRVPAPVADGLEAAANMGVSGNMVAAFLKRIAGAVTSSITAGRASFLPVNMARDVQDYAIRTLAQEGGNVARLPSIIGTWLDEAGRAAADIVGANANVRGLAGAGSGAITGAATGDEGTTVAERVRNAAAGAVAGTFLVGANRARVTGNAREFAARGGGSGPINPGWRAGQRWYRDVQRDAGAPIRTPADMANFLRDWGMDILSLRGVKAINERTELISRTAAMRRADQRGLPATEAMLAGRDVTYDPDRAGTVIRAANGIVPFLNATVQSGAQLQRLFRQHPVAATVAMVSTLAPVMLLTEAWNRSDSERARVYDDVPQYIKDSGLVVVLPWAGSDNRGERPNYLWIPTGLATPAVIAMRSALQNVPGLEPSAGRVGTDPDAPVYQKAADVLLQAVQVFSPIKGDSPSAMASNVVPPIAKQAVELGLNKDLYRGAPVASDTADERASGLGRAVAGAVNTVGRVIGSDALREVRPSHIDYAQRQLPAYGDITTGASDIVAPSPYKQAEDRPVQNAPFLGGIAGRFVRDTGGANLERAQAARMSPAVREALDEAGMRPSDVPMAGSRVTTDYGPMQLTREEMVTYQESMNDALDIEIERAQRTPEWRAGRVEEAVSKAMSEARKQAADAVLRGVSKPEQRSRAQEAEALKVR